MLISIMLSLYKNFWPRPYRIKISFARKGVKSLIVHKLDVILGEMLSRFFKYAKNVITDRVPERVG